MNRDAIRTDIQWTPRQREVLDLIARGLTNAEIAERLQVSLNGAKWHVREVFAKLGVDSREEAAEYWRERQRLGTRAKRNLRGLLFAGSLRWAAVGTASLAGIAALTVAVLPFMSGPEYSSAAAASTPGPAVFTQAEAEEHVLEKAAFTANMMMLKSNFQPYTAADFTLDSITYHSGVLSIDTNVEGYQQEFPAPSNVWSAALHQCDYSDPDYDPGSCDWVIVIEDGSGELAAGGHKQKPFSTVPGVSDGPIELKRITTEGYTFWLYLELNPDARFYDEPDNRLMEPYDACIARSSSDQLGGSFTCTLAADFPEYTGHRSLFVISSNARVSRPSTTAFLGYMDGLASPEVVAVRAYSNTGVVVTVETGPVVDILGEPWRGWITVTQDSQFIARVEGLDAAGNVVASEDGWQLSIPGAAPVPTR